MKIRLVFECEIPERYRETQSDSFYYAYNALDVALSNADDMDEVMDVFTEVEYIHD